MTKRSNQPSRAVRAGGAAPAHSTPTPLAHLTSRTLLLAILVLAFGALLAGCTRDRPISEGDVSTVGDEAVPMSETALVAAPAAAAPANQGEPEVEVSTPTTDTTADGTPAPGAVTIEEYEVKSGDTLASIADSFDASVSELRTMNRLATDLIQIGQKISVPVKPAEPTPTPEPFYHTVQAGDSLTGIAAQYGVSWADIVTANKMPDPNALRAGMKLLIPGYGPAGSTAGEGEGEDGAVVDAAGVGGGEQATHTVKAGQTLTEIASMYNIPLRQLQSANNIANSSLVKTGQVLVLPGMTVQQALDALSTTHTVGAGESLSGIAKEYGVPMAEIMRANNLSNANLIKPGQVLIIPPPGN